MIKKLIKEIIVRLLENKGIIEWSVQQGVATRLTYLSGELGNQQLVERFATALERAVANGYIVAERDQHGRIVAICLTGLRSDRRTQELLRASGKALISRRPKQPGPSAKRVRTYCMVPRINPKSAPRPEPPLHALFPQRTFLPTD